MESKDSKDLLVDAMEDLVQHDGILGGNVDIAKSKLEIPFDPEE